MTNTVLILGASGKIGKHSAHAFQAAGWKVKKFNRHSQNMTKEAKDVDVIINGMNPQNYHNWKNIIPRITSQVIKAARKSGASVIIPGNVYHFGDQGGVWSENTAARPVARKGQIRLDMERAYKTSGVQTIILRAGSFIDPDRNGCIMTEVYMREIQKRKILFPGPKDTRHAFCFVPDWARAAAKLATLRKSFSGFEDIPFQGHTLTAFQIKNEIEKILGHKIKESNFPWWQLSLASPFWELARELKEMRYLWQTNHELCDTKFKSILPKFEVTPLSDVLFSCLPVRLLQSSQLTRA